MEQVPASTAIRDLRGPREPVDPERPQAVWDEQETAAAGTTVTTRVMILTGSECRFTCSMCDLWRHTLASPTPVGSLPTQIRAGLALPASDAAAPRWLKLYNGSNFFDQRSVPREDLPTVAQLARPFERVVVENHPRLHSDAVARFRDQLTGQLEVAMGLETAHPEALAALNKQMTLSDFEAACSRLHGLEIETRAFVLLGVPGVPPKDTVAWCRQSVACAIDCGVRHVSVVPLRAGNGWIDQQIHTGCLELPTAADLEQAADEAVALPRSSRQVVTVDLWDFDRLRGTCQACRVLRRDRLEAMNVAQVVFPWHSSSCGCCQ